MSSLTLCFLGLPKIECDHRLVKIETRKAVALLAYLAITRQRYRRETLTTLLWPDVDQKRAKASLRTALFSLRRNLGEDWLVVEHQEVGLNWQADIQVDVIEFRQLLASEHAHSAANKPANIAALSKAIELYEGDFLIDFSLPDGLEFDEWQFFERENLRRLMMAALESLIQHYRQAQAFDLAIDYAGRLVKLDPLHEIAHYQLMELYAHTNQLNAALRQYQVCARMLEESLGVQPSAEIEALYAQIRRQPLSVPSPMMSPSNASSPLPLETVVHQSNLPTRLTPFVGRSQELIELKDRLSQSDCRLLTLVGSGGIGKTRLAIQLTKQMQPYEHGICYVDLAPLRTVNSLPSTIMQALNLSIQGQTEPEQRLCHYLAQKEMLLLLDNFEHLLEGSQLLINILGQAPRVKIMVTSRENLEVEGEWLYPVAGLTVPTSIEVDNWHNYGSIRLFLQLVHQQTPLFNLENEAHAVLRICQLVEGMPLGLELAAAWVKVLSCGEIAHEIATNLDFLTNIRRDASDRHRSLRAVFEHSWNLLSDSEQSLLAQLSIFRGGFTREALLAVTGASLVDLYRLVNKSLLHMVGHNRYDMHELLKQFTTEKLRTQPGLTDHTRTKHATYYGAYMQEREFWWDSEYEQDAIKATETELQNIRSGWHWAVTQQRIDTINAYMDGLFAFYEVKCWYQEGYDTFGLALTKLKSESELSKALYLDNLTLTKLLTRQAEFCAETGQLETALDMVQQSIARLQDYPNQAELALAYRVLGGILYFQGSYQAGKQAFLQSLTLSKEVLSAAKIANIYLFLGAVEVALGDNYQAKEWHLMSLELYEQAKKLTGIGLAQHWLGVTTQALNRYDEAKQYYEQSLGLFQTLDDSSSIALTCNNLGLLDQVLGKYIEANNWFRQSLDLYQEIGEQLGMIYALNYLGENARLRQDYQAAVSYLQKTLDLALKANSAPLILRALFGSANTLIDAQKGIWPTSQPADSKVLSNQTLTKAFYIFRLVAQHAASPHEIRSQAQTQLVALSTQLPADVQVSLQAEADKWVELIIPEMLTNRLENIMLLKEVSIDNPDTITEVGSSRNMLKQMVLFNVTDNRDTSKGEQDR